MAEEVVGVEPKESMAFEGHKILLGTVLPMYHQVSVLPMKCFAFDPIPEFVEVDNSHTSNSERLLVHCLEIGANWVVGFELLGRVFH